MLASAKFQTRNELSYKPKQTSHAARVNSQLATKLVGVSGLLQRPLTPDLYSLVP